MHNTSAISVMFLSVFREHIRFMKAHLLVAAMLLSVPAFAADPKPPKQICIGSSCVSTPAESSAKKKWHPGHYLKTQGVSSSIDQASYVQGVMNMLPRTLDIPEMRGAYATFAWGAINPTGTTYRWTDMDTVLNWLCDHDKMLILSISYKSFGATAPELIMPADLVAEGEYATTKSGVIAAIWRDKVMNRFIDTYESDW